MIDVVMRHSLTNVITIGPILCVRGEHCVHQHPTQQLKQVLRDMTMTMRYCANEIMKTKY